MTVSKAQQRAKKKWDSKNKDRNRIYRYRSYARKFVKDIANEDDLKELQNLIQDRLGDSK